MTTKEDFEEIYLERARFLLSTDEILEQILDNNMFGLPYQESYIKNPDMLDDSMIEHDIMIETIPITCLDSIYNT